MVGPKRDNAEERLQKAVWQHVIDRGTKDTIIFHVPNGGQRKASVAGRLKGMGLLPGVADFACTLADGSSAYLELKVQGGRQSEDQLAFQARCDRIGAPYIVCYSLDVALAVLEGWGVLKPDRNRIGII